MALCELKYFSPALGKATAANVIVPERLPGPFPVLYLLHGLSDDYTIWQRNNLWMLFNALDEACDPQSADPNITLIALWDGAAGDGTGGTGDLVDKVENLGARVVRLDTKVIFKD